MKRPLKYSVRRIDQLAALASPARMDVFTTIESLGRCTAAEVARATGRTHSSLYFHLEKLLAVGLLVREEHPGGARFSTPGQNVVLAYDPTDPPRLGLLLRSVTTVMRAAERALRTALESGRARVKGQNVNTYFMSHRAALTPEERHEVFAHMRAVSDIYARARRHRTGSLSTFTACMAPLPARVQTRTPASATESATP